MRREPAPLSGRCSKAACLDACCLRWRAAARMSSACPLLSKGSGGEPGAVPALDLANWLGLLAGGASSAPPVSAPMPSIETN